MREIPPSASPPYHSLVLSNRALVVTVLVSSVLWVGLGAAGEALAFVGAVPSAVSSLLLPPSVPTALWFGPRAEVLATAVLAGLLHAAVLALLLRVVLRRAVPGIITVWFAVLVTAFVSSGVLALGFLVGQPSASGLRALSAQTVALLTPAGLWGLVWGWLPALVGTRFAWTVPPARPRIALLPPVLAAIVAVAVALLVLPTLGRQQDPGISAAPSPTPSITHYSWASIAPVPAQGSTVAASACGSNDLALTVDAGDAATGHRALGIRVENRSERACTLEGYADVVFDDHEGDAMDVLVTHGGSFMTTDPGAERVRLAPGRSAVAQLGWNAQNAAGEQRAGKLFVSAYPGAARLPAVVDLDIMSGGAVALTAWRAAAA